MTAENVPAIDIHCPELFRDPDFAAWVDRRAGKGLATWHVAGEEAGDFSDVFLVYDHGECGDATGRADEAMPESCWEKLDAFLKARGVEYAFGRLINC